MCRRNLIQVRDVDYFLDEKNIFQELNINFAKHKTGLVGPNGIGKSTLLKLIIGEIAPIKGQIVVDCELAYVPQLYLSGNEPLSPLSGGQETLLKLNAALRQRQSFLLLDKPTNHLGKTARLTLYERLLMWEGGMLVISHDRTLLNAMDEIVTLSSLGAKSYGGNYHFYQIQAKREQQSAQSYYQATQKLLSDAKKKNQQRKERHEKNQAKGIKEKQSQIKAKGCYDKIALKSAKGKSEVTRKRIVMQSQRKEQFIENQRQIAKSKLLQYEMISLPFIEVKVPQGKIMLHCDKVSFRYSLQQQLIENLSFTVQGPERVAITGDNAKGKSTLLKLILGQIEPLAGSITVGTNKISVVDQQAQMLNHQQSVLENYLSLNPSATPKEAYRQLAHFLFKKDWVHQRVSTLSGGERVRCQLACSLLAAEPPHILLLDEPTNHLDLESISQVENILREYQGVLMVVSHDEVFLENINIERIIQL